MNFMDEKAEKIIKDFKESGSALIAFSGGVDSSVLAYLAKNALGKDALAITVESEIYSKKELKESREIAEEIDLNQKVITLSLLNNKEFVKNNSNRCYYCKKKLFSALIEFAEKNDYKEVAEGTNASEIEEHRPGYKAIKELGIYSPFAKYGLEDEDVRDLAKKINLPISSKPSMSCLASRISHREEITKKKLDMVEEAEKILTKEGFKQYRVRKHGAIARIELPKDKKDIDRDLMNKLNKKIKKIGFKYVTLDLEGYRTGSMEGTN